MAEGRTSPDLEWPLPPQEVRGDRNGPLAWGQYGLLRGALALTQALPDSARGALVDGLARLGTRLERRHSDAARRFLTQAFGADLPLARREELVRAAWRMLFKNALDDALFARRVMKLADPLSRCRAKLCDDAATVLESGRGGLFVTGHLGAWEAFMFLGPLLGIRPLYVVSRPPRNGPLSAFMQRTREERGIRLIHRHGAVRSVTRVLSSGGYVAMLVDQRARGRTVVAPFFGRAAHCERSVSVLLRRTRVPLMVAACFESERAFHYEVRVPRVFWPRELEALSPEETMAAINGELERMIVARPEQYFWLHDRYRRAPTDGEPVLQA